MMATRVVKVGGSLLDWPLLPETLTAWLDAQPPAFNVIVCGGGELANSIRRADRVFSIGDESSHWLCIDALSISARLLIAILPESSLVATYRDLIERTARAEPGSVVVDPREFLRDQEPRLPGRKLPHDWSVTSDSIAARLARVVSADELVLLKSSDPSAESLVELAAAGFVDRYLPVAAAAFSGLRIVNLRSMNELQLMTNDK